MFTGLVQDLGTVDAQADGRLRVRTSLAAELALGDSIAVNGVCLTVVDVDGADFSVELVPETLRRSSLSAVTEGGRVNLERALASGQRFGGHIVQGHVDTTATVISHTPGERTAEIRFRLNGQLTRYVVEKGSIAVDGVSLTVASVDEDSFTVALIPTTLAETTLGARQPGELVNIEVDVVAKYIERLVLGYRSARRAQAPVEELVEPVEEGGARSW
jgi:riboflavin synthase